MGLITVPAELLLATHLLAAALGGMLAYAVVVHWTDLLHHRRTGEPMPNRRLRPRTWLAIVVLIASGVVVAIGVAALLQKQADEQADRDRAEEYRTYADCLTQWGDDLVGTINERNDTRAAYDEALAADAEAGRERDDAVAKVVRVILRLREVPPTASDTDLQRALEQVREADVHVRRTARELDAARSVLEAERPTYKTPRFECGRTP